MAENALVLQRDREDPYVNDPATIFQFCDITAVAQLIYSCARLSADDGMRTITVSLADIDDLVERVLQDKKLQSEAFRNSFADGDGIYLSDRQDIILLCCMDLVQSGWVEVRPLCGKVQEFSGEWEQDRHLVIEPTLDFLRLMEMSGSSV